MGELVELIVDKYDGSLKAEHGTGVNMAPYVEREWGAKATEMMWRVKELADPRRRAQPRRRAEPRPGRPPAQPEDAAADRGGRGALRRVRLLRAGLPEPQRDDDAAPADRHPPRDGAPARGLAGLRGAARRLRVRRDRDLRGRRQRARRRARWRSTPASWSRSSARRERTDARGARGARAGASARRRSSGSRAAGLRGAALGAARRRRRARSPRCPSAVRRRVSAELVPALPASLPPAAPARAARRPRAQGAAAVYLPACINRIFGNPRGSGASRRCPRRWCAVSARAGVPVWIPPDVAGQLLRDAVELEGLSRAGTSTWRGGRPRRCGAGARAASCRS